ncbi:MAG TPA: ATP-binding cassette domain-containing protein [Phaeodactylibacter sp.]|nr:ATP-binding cassette domain-containing protein [Phaeodactylibacter sp.]
MDQQPILQLRHILKQYGDFRAVDEVSFDLPKGSIFGLLGPNGAGKTTLIRIITTIIPADEGEVFLNGERLHERHPEIIGYMPEERGLYKRMKVGEHLMYLAQLKGLSKQDARRAIESWFERLQIKDWWNKKVEELSKGMQQKIQFIATVVHKPMLLILDEPFSGLDPVNTELLKDEIMRLREEGATIIFSTHRMEQVEEICERIVLINRGKKILEGEVSDIRQEYKENLFEIRYQGQLDLSFESEVQAIVENKPGRLVIKLEREEDSNALLRRLLDQGIYLQSFKEILPSLNEIFIKTVNEKTETAVV